MQSFFFYTLVFIDFSSLYQLQHVSILLFLFSCIPLLEENLDLYQKKKLIM